MKTGILRALALSALALLPAVALAVYREGAPVRPPQGQGPGRDAVDRNFQAGNFKDAYDGYRALVLDPKAASNGLARDFRQAFVCLQQLGRIAEVDAFAEAALDAHPDDAGLWWEAAKVDREVEHYGVIVAGKFERGPHRGNGQFAGSVERDRARSLQRLVRAVKLRPNDGPMLMDLAETLEGGNFGREGWKLQELTPLDTLPDFEEQGRRFGRFGWQPSNAVGAPVDAEGNPVFHKVPESFDAAKTDGERWRWALMMAAEASPDLLNRTRLERAEFLRGQFGVQTIADLTRNPEDGEDRPVEAGPLALAGLTDDETIARLATGPKRFPLPDEFNYLKLYRQVLAESRDANLIRQALGQLVASHEDRRQYARAAEVLRDGLARLNPPADDPLRAHLAQIVNPWGRFEPSSEQPAGTEAVLSYRFRNGQRVDFEAWALNEELLLNDVKAYLQSKPAQPDWSKMQIDNIGWKIISENQNRYLKAKVAGWSQDVKPRPGHEDARVEVKIPLKTPGAYLVTGKLAGGNVARVVVWVADTGLVKKPIDGKSLVFVADAVTGAPVSKAEVEIFGWQIVQVGQDRQQRQQVETTTTKAVSDADGLVAFQAPEDRRGGRQYLITAKTPQGRFAYLGFTNVWVGQRREPEYNQVHGIVMTDRPVYRPKQAVHYKLWVARTRYDAPEASEFAGREFTVEVRNPKGEVIQSRQLVADAFGGLEGALDLSVDATLGVYQVRTTDNLAHGSFRVEEYKKPEFEVTVDAPTAPVALGETFEATIKARYYFGAPVVNGKVKYKVTRTVADAKWFPPSPWDWLYGPGYWWFGQDRTWYPGFARWACFGPWPPWWGRPAAPPEVVAEAEVPVGPDGTVKLPIDTAIAKAIHGDQDHRYSISAEVTDESRRTIVGSGDVLAAREPFRVFVWTDRGHYKAGDTVEASAAIRTADQKPVKGQGTLTLLKIAYDAAGKPTETKVQDWPVTPDDDGRVAQKVTAAESGQYRLSLTFTDEANRTLEGGYLLSVLGPGVAANSFRYNALELIPEKKEYKPGEKLRLMINTDRPGSTVLLFVRASNGVYPAPKVIRMDGRSHVEEIDVAKGDMPNFFVEAVTIDKAKTHTVARQIAVPPEARVVDVAVTPEPAESLPGKPAKVRLKLTGPDGLAFVGSTVVTIYDKSVEYISGGSNVPEIKAAFWSWKRNHHPQTETSLGRSSGNMNRPNEVAMEDIGRFGGIVLEEKAMLGAAGRGGFRGAGGGMMFKADSRARGFAGAAPAAPMAMAASPVPTGGFEPMALGMEMDMAREQGQSGATEEADPAVRKNFADTAYWSGGITTNNDGIADVDFDLPESLTTWKIRAWTLGAGSRVGQGESELITRKNLLLRLQAPRFFVQKDEVVLSANVHNSLATEKSVRAVLEFGNGRIEALDDASKTVTIAAGGEARVDWRVKVKEEGEAVVRMKALTDEESDAVEMNFPVYVHGMLKTESYSVALRPDEASTTMTVRVPEERRPEATRLEIRYSPTLAGAMVDALPYLADYPYGCTEQTLNRFLPTVITEKVLINLGLDLSAIRDKRTNLNAQELGDPAERARKWNRPDYNPVFDAGEVRAMAKSGLARLADMQCSDGGWGWFSGGGERSSAHTTAVVVHGLQVGKAIDLTMPEGLLEKGVAWLERYQGEQVARLKKDAKDKDRKAKADDLDAFVFMILNDAGVKSPEMLAFLDRDRVGLSVQAKAMFGIALQSLGEADKLAVVLQNIAQFLVVDDENQTAHLKLPDQGWWFWYNNGNEAMAYYLKLLAKADPKGEIAPKLVKYLVNNRRNATYWGSTRDTALCIEALADYMKASGEDRPDLDVTVLVDGKESAKVRVTAENLFAFDNAVSLVGDQLASGEHKVEIRKEGRGALYANAYLTNFTLEDPIAKAGLEVKVERKVYKLIPEEKTANVAGDRGQVVAQKVEKYRRELLADNAELKSGDLVEIELEVDSKNDYEYLIFEDFKAAGFEPVDVRSGYNGNAMGAYVEFRDERVAFFVRNLTLGKHSVAYRLRAEIPGTFSALPARGYAMYAPELKGNSDEIKLRIAD